MKETRVLIATPLKGQLSPAYSNTIIGLMNSRIEGHTFGHAIIGGSSVACDRDKIAKEMEDGKWDRVLSWDADLRPELADFVRLLSHPEEFVCGAYCKREPLTHWHFSPVKDADILPSGLWEQNQAAIGFSVISKSVFDRIKAARPDLQYFIRDGAEKPREVFQYFPMQIVGPNTPEGKLGRLKKLLNGKLDHPFNATELLMDISQIVDADDYSGNYMQGEDYGLCRLARDTGSRIWLDSKLIILHAGECTFPIKHDDVVRMGLEQWRQDYWKEQKAKLEKVA